MNTIKVTGKRFKTNGILLSLIVFHFLLSSCSPEAKWSTKDVELTMTQKTVSAGFVEYEFSTNKEAYYLIAIEKARPDYDPMKQQKQFMTLALDSANVEYLQWRHNQLENGEFNIAPFASHALQYGSVNHFFTNLVPETKYWIYAFVVNPDKMEPVGKLHFEEITTKDESAIDVYFEYRVRGKWDYIYPVDKEGNIYGNLPYMSNVIDSLDILEQCKGGSQTDIQLDTVAINYFVEFYLSLMETEIDLTELLNYGVKVTEHDFSLTDVNFEEGHTYYTAIVAWDGVMGNNVIYKFKWTGEDFDAYFKDEDSFIYNW